MWVVCLYTWNRGRVRRNIAIIVRKPVCGLAGKKARWRRAEIKSTPKVTHNSPQLFFVSCICRHGCVGSPSVQNVFSTCVPNPFLPTYPCIHGHAIFPDLPSTFRVHLVHADLAIPPRTLPTIPSCRPKEKGLPFAEGYAKC